MKNHTEQVEEVKKEAVEFFLNLKGNCTEAILYTLKRQLDLPLTEDQLAIATGFGGGMNSGCACGALTGAIMAVSLETGRRPGQPSENPPRATVLAGEMVEYFKEQNRMTCCRGLIPGLKKGDPERKKRCSVCVEQMSGKAAEIILTEREKALK